MPSKYLAQLQKSRLSINNSPSKYDSFARGIKPSLKYDSSNSRVNMPGSKNFPIPSGQFISTNFWINQTFNPENVDNVYAVGSGMDSQCNSFILMADYWTSPNNPNQDSGQNFLLQKFNDAGDLVWNRVFDFEEDGTTYTFMDVQTMIVDKDDNIIVFVIPSFASGARRTGIVKFDNDGNQLWSKVLLSDLPENVYNAEGVNSIAFDASNNMYISLSIYDTAISPNSFISVRKISPAGVVLASKTITFANPFYESFINVNSIGEVYLVGRDSTAPDYKNYIIKLDSSLNEIWNKSFSTTYNAYIYGVALDKDENIVFQTGNGASAYDINPLYGAYIKVSPAGEIIWTTRISNVINPDYSLGTYQLNSDADGNVYISSVYIEDIPDYPDTSNSLIVAKLSPAGAFEWAYFVQPSSQSIDSWFWYSPIAGTVKNNCLVLGYYDNIDPFNAQMFKLPLTPVANGVYGDYTFTDITDQWTTSSPELTLSDDTATYEDGPTDTSPLTYITFEGNTYTTTFTSL